MLLNEQTLKAAMLDMITSSGYLDAAGLTPADAALRLNLDFSREIAATLDVSDSLEHVEILTDYASVFGPVVHGVAFKPSLIDNAKTLLLVAKPLDQETASSDDDEDDTDLDGIDDELDDDDAAEEEIDEEDVEDDDEAEEGSDIPASKRKSDGALKVLVTPDMHKMASRLYSVLGDVDNMSDYVTYMRDLDELLHRYGGIQAKPKGEDDEDDKEAAFLVEMATLATHLETAKKKKKDGKNGGWKEGRSGLLSALMGKLGDRVQQTWDKVLPEDFKAAMSDVVSFMAQKLAEEQDRRSGGKEEAKLTQDPTPEEPAPICVMIPVVNGSAIQEWAKEAGFTHTMLPTDFHATVAYSKKPVDWSAVPPIDEKISIAGNNERTVARLGDNGATVLHLTPEDAKLLRDRWSRYNEHGASWDYDDYTPHITISWKEEFTDEQLAKIKAYNGPILFDGEIQTLIKAKSGEFDVNKIEHVPLN